MGILLSPDLCLDTPQKNISKGSFPRELWGTL